ncbi:MAG: hypothetical protein RL194_269, partial [Pseudomonadota bacterium]
MQSGRFNVMRVFTLGIVFAGLVACSQPQQKVSGLKTPESVIQAQDGRIFVSEINEFGKDGDGQISVIDQNGKLSIFATG